MSSSHSDEGYPYNLVDTLGIFIPVSDVQKYSVINPRNFIRDAFDGYLEYKGALPKELPPQNEKDTWSQLLQEISIPLSELEPSAIRSYLLHLISDDHFVDIDFTAYKKKYGLPAYDELLCDFLIIRNIHQLSSVCYSDDYKTLQEKLLNKYSLSLSDYKYRLEQFQHTDFQKILSMGPAERVFSLCPKSEDFIYETVYKKCFNKRIDVFNDLLHFSNKEGSQACKNCPHNPDNEEYNEMLHNLGEKYPYYRFKTCQKSKKTGMVVPESASTVYRFLNNMDKSTVYLAHHDMRPGFPTPDMHAEVPYATSFKDTDLQAAQNGDNKNSSRYPRPSNAWSIKYANKIKREKCLKINEVVFCDHSMLNVWLFAGFNTNKEPVILHPWATCMLDMASGAITGSVLSFHVTSRNIGECLARASCLTIDSPFYGLPRTLYCDRGKDFTAKYIASKNNKKISINKHNSAVNRAIFANGLLPALNVNLRHASPRSPWVKPIEGAFSIINQNYLSKVPGWMGTKHSPKNAEHYKSELMRLLSENQLWDMDKFAHFWFHYVIPAFNSRKMTDGTIPVENYHTLERADTLTPSWATMGVFLQERKRVLVTDQGFYYNKILYDDILLTPYIGKYIYVFDFDSYATECVYALYSDSENNTEKFIGEIPRKEAIAYEDPQRTRLARGLAIRQIQKKQCKDSIESILALSEINHFARFPYLDYDVQSRIVTRTMYAEKGAPYEAPEIITHISRESLLIAEKHEEAQLCLIRQVLSGSDA